MYVAEAKRRGAKLAITGVEEVAVRYAHDHERADRQERQWVSRSGRTLFAVREDLHNTNRQPSHREHQALLLPEGYSVLQREGAETSETLLGNPATVRESTESELGQLRSTRDRESFQERACVCCVCVEEIAAPGLQRGSYRTEGQRRALQEREHQTGDSWRESAQ